MVNGYLLNRKYTCFQHLSVISIYRSGDDGYNPGELLPGRMQAHRPDREGGVVHHIFGNAAADQMQQPLPAMGG